MNQFQKLREKALAEKQKKENNTTNVVDNALYPFWNAPVNSTTTLRFLSDADPTNEWFHREKIVIDIPFEGIKGVTDNRVKVTVPCMHMFGEKDYIIDETKSWWGSKDTEELAKRYWKKKSYLLQGFVVQSSLNEENPPENPIRRFIFKKSVFDKVFGIFLDPDTEDMPIDIENGLDFRIIKTMNGQYPDYTNSSWARRTRPLSSEERDAIDTYGMYDLKNFLPRKPTAEDLDVIKQMFHASVEDKPYDPEWANHYKPYGFNFNNIQSTNDDGIDDEIDRVIQKSKTVKQEVNIEHEEEDSPFEIKDKQPKKTVNDILKAIKKTA